MLTSAVNQKEKLSMKEITINIFRSLKEGGLTAPYLVPSEAAEFDAFHKTEGKCCETAVASILNWGVRPSLRDTLATWIEDNTDAKRHTRTEVASDGTEREIICEHEEPFAKRAIADGALSLEDLEAQMKVLCATDVVTFEEFCRPTERKPKFKRAGKEIEAYVQKAIDDGKDGALSEKLSAALSRCVTVDPRDLGNAVKEHRQNVINQINATLTG